MELLHKNLLQCCTHKNYNEVSSPSLISCSTQGVTLKFLLCFQQILYMMSFFYTLYYVWSLYSGLRSRLHCSINGFMAKVNHHTPHILPPYNRISCRLTSYNLASHYLPSYLSNIVPSHMPPPHLSFHILPPHIRIPSHPITSHLVKSPSHQPWPMSKTTWCCLIKNVNELNESSWCFQEVSRTASPRVMVVAAGSVSCIYEVLCMPCLRIRILHTPVPPSPLAGSSHCCSCLLYWSWETSAAATLTAASPTG